MQHRQGQDEDEHVGGDVEAGVAPEVGQAAAVGGRALGEVPVGVERDARREERREDARVADEDDAEERLGGQPEVVVGQDADVQAEDGELGARHGEDVEDGEDEADLDI